MPQVVINLRQRPWQKPLVAAFRGGIKHGVVIAHRRAGKDRVALFIELERALAQRCEVWHSLPEQEQARKVVWDAITGDGQKLIDEAFPRSIIKRRSESEMKIELVNGSIWRLVGADRFNSLIGSNPKHVTMSEYATTDPRAREYIRPILAENGGSELLISTPRGYNHCFKVWTNAASNPLWYSAIHPVSETKLISEEALAEERREMADELYRQEYECDFSAANIGSILGRYIEQAERDGRLNSDLAQYDPDGPPIIVSSDIGFRDASAWWFWQRRADGVALVDYIDGTGMDADDWIDKLMAETIIGRAPLAAIWLPRDARVKTFQSKRSAMAAFLSRFGTKYIRITPACSISDRINAARVVMRKCWFTPQVAEGVQALREWSFKIDAETRKFSAEPLHDWASHPGDAFSYGAQVLDLTSDSPSTIEGVFERVPERQGVAAHAFTLDDLAEDPLCNPALMR